MRGTPYTRSVALALLALAPALSGAAGVDELARYAVPNGDFGAGLAGWSASSAFDARPGPGARPAVRARVAPGALARLASTFTIDPRAAAAQERVACATRVYLEPDVTGGELRLRVRRVDRSGGAGGGGSGGEVVLESAPFAVESVPRGRWLTLPALPLPGERGSLTAETHALEIELILTTDGTVWIDEVVAGRWRASEYALVDPSFEDPNEGQGAGVSATWTSTGTVSRVRFEPAVAGAPTGPPDAAYYGSASAALGGAGTASIRQSLALDAAPGAPWPGERPEACAWVYVELDAALRTAPDPSRSVALSLVAVDASGARRTIAERVWSPVAAERGAWVFLHTPLAARALELADARLEVVLAKSFAGTLRADFVQAGGAGGVDGNPRRLVTASYVGWYRSPFSAQSVAPGASSRQRWRNWSWTDPPYADPTNATLIHDPDCLTSPTCIRANGRRDGAVSVLGGIDHLPLAGTYDSRDPDIARWHVDLARAAGLDSFVYDWMGYALSQQSALPGEEAINQAALLALVDAADRPGSDFKIGVMYEPKAHMLGWVQGQPSFAERKQGITDDLVWLVENLYDRSPMWKRDGRLVVFVFRHTVGIPGGESLTEADWYDIAAEVEARTGRGLALVATELPGAPPSPFEGFLPWRLVDASILRYPSYERFLSNQPTIPPPNPQDVRAFADSLASLTAGWTAADPGRFGVGMAWPGFDDSGVAGWGQPNGQGIDLLPLRVRVVRDLGTVFTRSTSESARAGGADWLHFATWNDWNESTALEPAWHPSYEAAVALGQPAPSHVIDAVLGQLMVVQREAAAFKGAWTGTTLLARDLEGVTRGYVRRALAGQVVRYD